MKFGILFEGNMPPTRPATESEILQVEKMIQDAGLCLGDPDRCAEIISKYRDAGCDQFLGIAQYGNLTHEEILEGIRLFGREVIPKFQ